MRFQSYLNHALSLIGGFDGRTPLSHYLKQYFKENKKHGSTDRKLIAHLCYSWFRLGHAVKELLPAERMKIALFLCTDDRSKWSPFFEGEGLLEGLTQSGTVSGPAIADLSERIARVQQRHPSFAVKDIFPWKDELSDNIDHHSFCLSFLRQPDLFLRIRPGYEKEALQKLEGQQFEFIPPFTLRLPNGFKTETFFTPDREIVIQDHSSQCLAPFLQLPASDASPSAKHFLWDACAGSGGKSILAYDLNPGIDLTVSDIREFILQNLHRRFRVAGISNYHSFVTDLTKPAPPLRHPHSADSRPRHGNSPGPPPSDPQPFDLILADTPCTGSGTWSRNPEELYFFDPAKITAYRDLQERIVSRLTLGLIPRMGKKACLVYSTCSVFKKENEGMVSFIGDSLGMIPERMEMIMGYENRADSMFAARFTS
jgi:16S rRNA (cytosine967-C5)-methyltransferase